MRPRARARARVRLYAFARRARNTRAYASTRERSAVGWLVGCSRQRRRRNARTPNTKATCGMLPSPPPPPSLGGQRTASRSEAPCVTNKTHMHTESRGRMHARWWATHIRTTSAHVTPLRDLSNCPRSNTHSEQRAASYSRELRDVPIFHVISHDNARARRAVHIC